MKKWICAWICVLLLACLSVCAFAQPPKIVDNAGLLTASEKADLESRAQSLSETLSLDLVIVTVDTTNGADAQAYADDYFDYHGYGYGENQSGILLLLVMDTRDWVISTAGDGIQRLPRSASDRLFDSIAGDIGAGRYYDGFRQYLSNLPDYLDSGDRGLSPVGLIVCVVLGLAAGGITLLIMRSTMKTAKRQHGAASYVTPGSYELTQRGDFFLYSRTSRVKKAESSGSGGRGTHIGSSGRSHGGSRGKF